MFVTAPSADAVTEVVAVYLVRRGMKVTDLAELLGPGSHGTTFGGNPLATSAALANIEYLLSHALQANTEIARQFIQQKWFFRCAKVVSDHGLLMMLVWVIPVTLMARVVARARHRRERSTT